MKRENESNYDFARRTTDDYFHSCMMGVLGSKTVDGYMYVKGGDNGFPHTRAHAKVDINTEKIVERYGAHDCPVYVSECVFD